MKHRKSLIADVLFVVLTFACGLACGVGLRHRACDHVALQRGDSADAVHAQAPLGRDQIDLVGEHSTKLFEVDREQRSGAGAALRSGCWDLANRCIQHLIGAGDYVQVLRPDLAFDHKPTREKVELLEVARVQTTGADRDLPLAYIEALEAALGVVLRRAGSQSRAIGVEKITAVAEESVRVGNDHIGLATRDFDRAFEHAAVRTHDFVDDDACGHIAQLRIAGDPAADLRLHDRRAVVQDQAIGIDVELLKLIETDTARTGRSDVHDRDAVLRGVDDGALPGGC